MPAIKAFTGLRNDVTAERFAEGDLARADNVNLDNTGKLLTRSGYLKRINGAFHSLWSNNTICLFVKGAELHQLQSDLITSTVIRNDLSLGFLMSYREVNGFIYYSNSKQTGIFSAAGNRTWGLAVPIFQPLANAINGSLKQGTYQYALTYIRRDGQESGTGIADRIVLKDNEAINFYDIPVSSDPDVSHKILYVSAQNGDVLYRATTLFNNVTSAVFNGGELRSPLSTQFKQQAPAGHLVSYFDGYMYVASDKFILYSDTYGYELFDMRDYLPFDSMVTMFAPVQDGVFIGTENRIYFVQGKDPKQFILTIKANYGVVANTLSYVSSALVKGLEQASNEPIRCCLLRMAFAVAYQVGNLSILPKTALTLLRPSKGHPLQSITTAIINT